MSLPSLVIGLLALVCLGILHDVLWTIYIKAVSSRQVKLASLISGTLTVFGFMAFWVISHTNMGDTILGISAYAAGSSVGTAWTLSRARES